jgi:hypothetical protein
MDSNFLVFEGYGVHEFFTNLYSVNIVKSHRRENIRVIPEESYINNVCVIVFLPVRYNEVDLRILQQGDGQKQLHGLH